MRVYGLQGTRGQGRAKLLNVYEFLSPDFGKAPTNAFEFQLPKVQDQEQALL